MGSKIDEYKTYEELKLIWESICYYEKALRKRIEDNNKELDIGQTRLLYTKVIEELRSYSKALNVDLNEQDAHFFSDYFENGKNIEGTIACLAATRGFETANKGRKWLCEDMLLHFEKSYQALNDYI